MKLSIAAGLLLFLGACSPPVEAVSDMDGKAKTLLLQTKTGSCGASAVGPDLVLTAEHCLDVGEAFTIRTADGREWKFKDVQARVKDKRDHLLLRLPSAVFKPSDLVSLRGSWFDETESFTLWGHAASVPWTFRAGRVARLNNDGSASLDCSCYLGDSGSPVFDNQGRVVAVINSVMSWSHVEDGALYRLQVMLVYPFSFNPAELKRLRD